MKIEVEIAGANFLVPCSEIEEGDYGYHYREKYCQALSQGGMIGHYEEGLFVKDTALTAQYANVIPTIGKALLREPHDPLYQRFKLASLEKRTLELTMEWRIADRLDVRHLSLQFAKMLRDQLELSTALVDLHGPTYEVVALDTVDAYIERVNIESVNLEKQDK